MINKLIIIPGLGDRGRIYGMFELVWKRLGFDTRVYVFGWNDTAANFNQRLNRLIKHIDAVGQPVSIIGVSAGGTAAIHALLHRPQAVRRVVTVASPLTNIKSFDNTLLMKSMATLEAKFSELTPEQERKILSVYGVYDQRVAAIQSQPARIRNERVPMIWHGAIIFCALMIFPRKIKNFLLA